MNENFRESENNSNRGRRIIYRAKGKKKTNVQQNDKIVIAQFAHVYHRENKGELEMRISRVRKKV